MIKLMLSLLIGLIALMTPSSMSAPRTAGAAIDPNCPGCLWTIKFSEEVCAGLGFTIQSSASHGCCQCSPTCDQAWSCQIEDIILTQFFNGDDPPGGCVKSRPSPIDPWSSSPLQGSYNGGICGDWVLLGQFGVDAGCNGSYECENTLSIGCSFCDGTCPN